ncbi:MAG: hypothetical protein IJ189_12770 [Clostridia bacterium]|nr:hypothetical protein [Clostridia bacterium]
MKTLLASPKKKIRIIISGIPLFEKGESGQKQGGLEKKQSAALKTCPRHDIIEKSQKKMRQLENHLFLSKFGMIFPFPFVIYISRDKG